MLGLACTRRRNLDAFARPHRPGRQRTPKVGTFPSAASDDVRADTRSRAEDTSSIIAVCEKWVWKSPKLKQPG